MITADPALRAKRLDLLGQAGHHVRQSDGLLTALASIAAVPPSLIIVEGSVDGLDAAGVCRRLQPEIGCPLLAIDRGADVIDRILALELGADDYLAQPVHDREFLVRVKTLLRRSWAPDTAPVDVAAPPAVPAGHPVWRLNLITRELVGPGRDRGIQLTPSEHTLMSLFIKQAGKVLGDRIATDAGVAVSEGQLRTVVARLRGKLAKAGFDADAIRNCRSAGYIFDAKVAARGVVTA